MNYDDRNHLAMKLCVRIYWRVSLADGDKESVCFTKIGNMGSSLPFCSP